MRKRSIISPTLSIGCSDSIISSGRSRSCTGISNANCGRVALTALISANRACRRSSRWTWKRFSTRSANSSSLRYSSGMTVRLACFFSKIRPTSMSRSECVTARSISGSRSRLSSAFMTASATLLMSIRHPVNLAASRAFWPSRPIASESWSSGTITTAVRPSSGSSSR